MPLPDLSLVPAFYQDYVRLVAEDDLREAIAAHLMPLIAMIRELPEETWNAAYAPGKWSLKELVQHVIDTERVFSYRAMCFARGEGQSLPGFDENAYAAASDANHRSGEALLKELQAVGTATELLFKSFTEQQLASTGNANNLLISVHSIGYIICGHALHHTRIVRERYLKQDLQG